MKKKLIYLLTLLIMATHFYSCDEDRTVDTSVMPDETQVGANTFGCLIGGWLFVGGRYFMHGKSIDFNYDKEKNNMDVYVVGPNYKTLEFTIVDPKEGSNSEITDLVYNGKTSDEWTGTADIKRFDKLNNIISGTFEFNVDIKRGRFDIEYDRDYLE